MSRRMANEFKPQMDGSAGPQPTKKRRKANANAANANAGNNTTSKFFFLMNDLCECVRVLMNPFECFQIRHQRQTRIKIKITHRQLEYPHKILHLRHQLVRLGIQLLHQIHLMIHRLVVNHKFIYSK